MPALRVVLDPKFPNRKLSWFLSVLAWFPLTAAFWAGSGFNGQGNPTIGAGIFFLALVLLFIAAINAMTLHSKTQMIFVAIITVVPLALMFPGILAGNANRESEHFFLYQVGEVLIFFIAFILYRHAKK